MASSAPTASQALAARIAGLRWASLPDAVRQMSRRVILDAIGCALLGSRTPEAGLLAAARADLGPDGACAVWVIRVPCGRPARRPFPATRLASVCARARFSWRSPSRCATTGPTRCLWWA